MGASFVMEVKYVDKWFSSYGIILLDENYKVLILLRRAPYALSSSLIEMKLDRELRYLSKYPHKLSIERLEQLGVTNTWQPSDWEDFQRFTSSLHSFPIFKDAIDFVHGQCDDPYPNSDEVIWETVLRELKEESGYMIDAAIANAISKKISTVPRINCAFDGLNGCTYFQHYFLVQVPRNKLYRVRRKTKERWLFDPKFISIEKAIEWFNFQSHELNKFDQKGVILELIKDKDLKPITFA